MPTPSRQVAPTLYQQLLGAPFFTLPDPVRLLHSNRGQLRCAGRTSVEGASGALARLFARLAGLPRAAADVPLTVDFVVDGDTERWHRDFGGMRMVSRLQARNGRLVERRGPLQFRFVLHVNDGMVFWNTAGVRLFGLLPLPARLFEGVRCRERANGDRYEFRVEAVLPLVGRVVRYEGWLAPIDAERTEAVRDGIGDHSSLPPGAMP